MLMLLCHIDLQIDNNLPICSLQKMIGNVLLLCLGCSAALKRPIKSLDAALNFTDFRNIT